MNLGFRATRNGALQAAATGLLCGLLALVACERKPPPESATGAGGATPGALVTTAPAASSVAATPEPVLIPPRTPTGTFLDRPAGQVLRLVSYNVNWNSIFPDVNARRAASFARLVAALDPDVLALQEIGQAPREGDGSRAPRRTAADVSQLMTQLAPLPTGGSWYAHQAGDNVIVSKYPLEMTRQRPTPAGHRDIAMALVRLPRAAFPRDLYVLNTHHKCCGGDENEALRRKQSDAIAGWVRDARLPGGDIDLPPGTPVVIVGDFNLVGGPQPLRTLLDGDVFDEAAYGPDFRPDWDDTPLADARPPHNARGAEDWTWRDDTSEFAPGRLDFVVYTDSVLDAVHRFVLDTTTMTPEELEATGLHKNDVLMDAERGVYDHLPVVVDFAFRTGLAANGDRQGR
jgi:endonuclease/exonuclease/phosphatase family metal-dependent hydrolase